MTVPLNRPLARSAFDAYRFTMKRRTAILSLTAAGATALAGGLAYVAVPRDHPELGMDRLLAQLHGLRADGIETASSWDVARTLNHLAQSVEFSMSGYPDLKSALFRHTVGPLAFNVFQTRGQMSHDTAAPIPGEVLDATGADAARLRLIDSLTAFQTFDPDPAPHFAYGALTKDAYAKAHVMHVHDHLVELRAV